MAGTQKGPRHKVEREIIKDGLKVVTQGDRSLVVLLAIMETGRRKMRSRPIPMVFLTVET